MKNSTIMPYERRANYYETDQMGIVHHTNYFRYFEEARMDFMRRLECSAFEMEKQGIIIPNIDAYAKYIRPIRYEDCFKIIVKPVSFTGAKMKFEYEIVKNDEICCTGYTMHCFVNSNMKPISLKKTHPAIFARLVEIFTQ